MSTFFQDIRYGVRMLYKNPGFTVVAALALALGIGVNTAIFSVFDGFLLRPLPVRAPEQLVVLAVKDSRLEFPHVLSYPDYLDYRDDTKIYSDLIAYSPAAVNLTADGRGDRSWVEMVTGNYFSMLGVGTFQGRIFSPEEGKKLNADPLVVLSYGFWQRRFGGDPSAIGKIVRVNNHPFTIIGVTPEGFHGTEGFFDPDFYVPLMMIDQLFPGSGSSLTERGSPGFRVMGRLQPGMTAQQAAVATNLLTQRLGREYPDTNKNQKMYVYPELRSRPEPGTNEFIPRVAAIFMALVGLVLLIACANVANLILARALSRRKEIAIRMALGASSLRLVRQLMTESVILGLLGGLAGFVLAQWAASALSAVRLPTDLPLRLFDIKLDWRIFLFNLVIALGTGFLAGFFPALQGTRSDVNEALKGGGRSSAGSPIRHRLRNALVVSQVAVSLLLLISAGLLIRSLKKSENADLGFKTDHLLMMSFDVGLQGYDPPQGKQFYQQLLDRVNALPGVRSASMSRMIPMGYDASFDDIHVEGQPSTNKEEKQSAFNDVVTSGYFQTMRIPLLQGRGFTLQDSESAPPVAIVNEAMAQQFWPGLDPLGKRFQVNNGGPYLQIVGIAKTGKYLYLYEAPRSFFYQPLAQSYQTPMTLEVYTEDDPRSLIAAIREQIRSLDSNLPVYAVNTMSSHIRDGKAMLPARLAATLVGVFGLLGLLLAAVGIYGVMSYSVSQRTQEIGVRMALGAEPNEVVRLVLKQGMLLALIGLGIGLILSFLATRAMRTILYGVSSTDIVTFGVISLLLALVALLASYIPARRATKVDPLMALRCE